MRDECAAFGGTVERAVSTQYPPLPRPSPTHTHTHARARAHTTLADSFPFPVTPPHPCRLPLGRVRTERAATHPPAHPPAPRSVSADGRRVRRAVHEAVVIAHAAGVNYRSFATRERAQCQSECEADARCAPWLSGIGP